MREIDPRDVIADILEELLFPSPKELAEKIVQRLRDAGFRIVIED